MRNLFLSIVLVFLALSSAYAQCKAQFIFKQLNDSIVQVWDSSAAENAYDVVFNFGDGDTSHDAEGRHIYDWSGYYKVCLSIYDRTTGCQDWSCVPGVVKGRRYNVILAEFAYETSEHTISFTDLSRGSNTIPHNCHWDFGDSATSTDKNPLHTYAKPGTYTVCLEVEDTIRHMTSKWCEQVTIEDPSGIAENMKAGSIRVYPNPAQDKLSLEAEWMIKNPLTVFVFDMTGKLVSRNETTAAGKEINLDIASLKPGIYQIKIACGNQVAQTKFLKM